MSLKTEWGEILDNRLKTYSSGEPDPKKRTILFGMQMVGTANAIIPVIKQLGGEFNWVSFNEQQSQKTMEAAGFFAGDTNIKYDRAIEYYHPDLVVTGVSQVGPNQERKFTRDAVRKNIPVLWVLDNPGGVAASHFQRLYAVGAAPQYFAVSDEWSKDFVLERVPGSKREQVFVTGQPAFDTAYELSQRKEVLRSQLRLKLGISEGEKAILFAGQLAGTEATLKTLLTVLPNGTVVLPRFHPTRDGNLARYTPALDTAGGVRWVNTMEKMGASTEHVVKSTEELVTAADVVTGMFSTVQMTGIYLRTPVAYLLFDPDGRAACRQDCQIPPEDLPMVQLRAAAGVFGEGDLQPVVKRLLYDDSYRVDMQRTQEKYYPCDGKNSQRVADVIRGILQH